MIRRIGDDIVISFIHVMVDEFWRFEMEKGSVRMRQSWCVCSVGMMIAIF